METEKLISQKLEETVNQLSDLLTQIWAINNALKLLYDILQGEQRHIAEPSSTMLVCTVQLDYIYKKMDNLLGEIMDCCTD